MCGIVGVLGKSDVADCLLEGLRRLEYRGYDSAMIALMDDGRIELRRHVGKVENLKAYAEASPIKGRVRIAHTRWATHGAAKEENAHPHRVGLVFAYAVVAQRLASAMLRRAARTLISHAT